MRKSALCHTQMICAFVFVYAKSRFSHEMAHIIHLISLFQILHRFINVGENLIFANINECVALGIQNSCLY